jgi:hypothetical protein
LKDFARVILPDPGERRKQDRRLDAKGSDRRIAGLGRRTAAVLPVQVTKKHVLESELEQADAIVGPNQGIDVSSEPCVLGVGKLPEGR